jgi:hypothetical protein
MHRVGSDVRVVFPGVVVGAGLIAVAALVGTGAAMPASRPAPQVVQTAAPVHEGTLPVVAEYRYRMAGKIRPLLFFWISKDGIGGARIRVRRGEGGASGLDLLIGSDPTRAPRGINRWGYILEETRGDETNAVGIMKKSEEDTLDQATSNVAREAHGEVIFKMIQATVSRIESVARVTVAPVPRDYTYRELDGLMAAMASDHPLPPTIRKTAMPPGGRPGLLTAVAELLHDGVESVRRTDKAPGRKSLRYVYYAKQYDVARTSASVETHATYGGIDYPRLLRASFEVRARGESWTEKFTIVCGIDGQGADVPVFVTYQPRWWLAVEMVRDDREKF